MSTFFTSKHDHPHINFVNETGDKITIQKMDIPTGFAFDGTTQAQYDAGSNKTIDNNSTRTYGFVATYNSMFNKVGNTVKFTYVTGDGSVKTHNATISGVRVYNHKIPTTVTVTLAYGNPGAPRPCKLKLQRGTINGFRYYLNSAGVVGMYFSVPTSGTPNWVLVYNGKEIAWYRSFLTRNTNCDSESGVLSFPMDGSFYGDTSVGMASKVNGLTTAIVSRGQYNQYASWFATTTGKADGLRMIYFQNVNWSAQGSVGVTSTPSNPNFTPFQYRSDRQYFNNGTGGNSKATGMDTQRLSFIYQLGINETPTKNNIIEWEVWDSGSGHFARFFTQLKHFTCDLSRLGVSGTGLVYTRARTLEIGRELSGAEYSAVDSLTKGYGRTSVFTGWKPFPSVSLYMAPERSAGSNGWFKMAVNQYYGTLYVDCGWDTKFNVRVTGSGYTRDHPMVFPGDWVAAGMNVNQAGVLGRHTFSGTLSFTHNSNNVATAAGTVLPGTPSNAATWIRDHKANWGGKGLAAGTYAEGYQCCGAPSGQNYTGRHNDLCAPSAEITKAKQDFFFGQTCPTFTGTNFDQRSGGNKWFSSLDVIYISDPTPKSDRSRWDGYDYDHRTSRNLSPFSSNVRSSYSEFQLTIDLPASWIGADDTITIEVQNAGGTWQSAIHMDGSSSYIHGYYCRWKISELPAAARSGNTWALTSANLPGRVNNLNPESGRSTGQMHSYVHKKNFDDLEPFGSHQGSNVYFAYSQRVARLKSGGHLGLGYVHSQGGANYCTPFSPSNTIQNSAVPSYKLRIRNVTKSQHSEPFTMQVTQTTNVRELAPFCEAYDDDDKDCS